MCGAASVLLEHRSAARSDVPAAKGAITPSMSGAGGIAIRAALPTLNVADIADDLVVRHNRTRGNGTGHDTAASMAASCVAASS